MKAREYIISKQIQWALNQGIRLIGSKGRRGRQTYVSYLNDNLFENGLAGWATASGFQHYQ